MAESYIRDDGATMYEVAPHRFVNHRALGMSPMPPRSPITRTLTDEEKARRAALNLDAAEAKQ